MQWNEKAMTGSADNLNTETGTSCSLLGCYAVYHYKEWQPTWPQFDLHLCENLRSWTDTYMYLESEMWGFYGSEGLDCDLLDPDAVQYCR